MLNYDPKLKRNARRLRAEMTDSERLLWSRLRRRQIKNVQFYRQKPIGSFIVDFYAPKARLVVEVDGSQHLYASHARQDQHRDAYLKAKGLRVLRFNNLQVLEEPDAVMETILRAVEEKLNPA